jgi:hypothetical protein
MPMYLRPYMLFSFHTANASATSWSGSERSGNPSPYFSANFNCLVGLSGLIPTTAVSPMSPRISLSPQACLVHPGVSALG